MTGPARHHDQPGVPPPVPVVPVPDMAGDYRPSSAEPFMDSRQQAYFRAKLLAWRQSIRDEAELTLAELGRQPLREPDQSDRATSESDWSLELRTRDRQRKLIAKIDAALRRLDQGDYGYCLVTGEPIAVERLDARPVATMTLEAQEEHERAERVFRDD